MVTVGSSLEYEMSVCEILKIAGVIFALVCVWVLCCWILDQRIERNAKKRAAAEMARIRAQHEIFVRDQKMHSIRAGLSPAKKKSDGWHGDVAVSELSVDDTPARSPSFPWSNESSCSSSSSDSSSSCSSSSSD